MNEHNNIVVENMKSAQPDRVFLKKEKKLGFAGEVEIARKNLKNSLEIKHYRETAKSLLKKYSVQEILDMGENNREELDLLCGDGNDSSVIAAICEYIMDQIVQNKDN